MSGKPTTQRDDTYGYLFENRLDEVADAMKKARDAEHRATVHVAGGEVPVA